ncbi:hypothetical protein [Streptomyces malaysiensis]|uniref:Uncharacterized protein n=1 Tax=Streptomyces malaysiensis TaxID=92644 RepID=A0A2J7Z9R2_STRMQ|nr:hypothetical protein [Streptomyces malaysiensis]MCQ6249259.1 hypothetical protein [Streptomyces malaysiensis]PNG97027.1 hypothetical protein SMF913_13052 [Streptomyces malaysiensis]
MGLFDWLGTKVERQKMRNEAAAFSRSVELNKTYYSIEECVQSWGNERYVKEWTFTRRSKLTGDPMDGSVSAALAWLRWGPLTDTKPEGLRTFSEGPRELFDPLGDNGQGHREYQKLMKEIGKLAKEASELARRG